MQEPVASVRGTGPPEADCLRCHGHICHGGYYCYYYYCYYYYDYDYDDDDDDDDYYYYYYY